MSPPQLEVCLVQVPGPLAQGCLPLPSCCPDAALCAQVLSQRKDWFPGDCVALRLSPVMGSGHGQPGPLCCISPLPIPRGFLDPLCPCLSTAQSWGASGWGHPGQSNCRPTAAGALPWLLGFGGQSDVSRPHHRKYREGYSSK